MTCEVDHARLSFAQAWSMLVTMFGMKAVLEYHLKECGDRYKAAADTLCRLEDKIESNRQAASESTRRIYGLLWAVAGATILSLATALASLVLKVIHP